MSVNVILTSDFPSNPHATVVERLRAVAPKPRVAWIAPGSALRRARFVAARHAFRSVGLTNLTCVSLAASTSHVRLVEQFDAVYLSGGNPIRFRADLADSGLDARLTDFVTAGGLVVAASGGAMQLTPNLSLYRLRSASVDQVLSERPANQGLAFIDVEFLPHLNWHKTPFLTRVQKYSEAVAHDIVALADGGALIWAGNTCVSSVGHMVRFRRGVMSPDETVV